MFTVYHSNQLDLLKTLTSALIARDPLADPFNRKWCWCRAPAWRNGCRCSWRNSSASPPMSRFRCRRPLFGTCSRVLPDIPKESAFSKDAMTWKLMWLLPEMLTQPAFAPLQHYLTDDGDKRKIHQLAGRVADLFDQYLVYRPQWLESWQRGERIDGLAEPQQWQAPLWARLVEYARAGAAGMAPRQSVQPLYPRAGAGKTCPPGLPPRVFICGISALPPVYWRRCRRWGGISIST